MSNVLSDWTKETIVETRKTKELEGIKCDKCGEVIETSTKNPKIYYRVKCSEKISGTYGDLSTDYADICPDCLYSYINNHFKNRGLATSVYVEKKRAVRIDIRSDKNGNFKI